MRATPRESLCDVKPSLTITRGEIYASKCVSPRINSACVERVVFQCFLVCCCLLLKCKERMRKLRHDTNPPLLLLWSWSSGTNNLSLSTRHENTALTLCVDTVRLLTPCSLISASLSVCQCVSSRLLACPWVVLPPCLDQDNFKL